MVMRWANATSIEHQSTQNDTDIAPIIATESTTITSRAHQSTDSACQLQDKSDIAETDQTASVCQSLSSVIPNDTLNSETVYTDTCTSSSPTTLIPDMAFSH